MLFNFFLFLGSFNGLAYFQKPVHYYASMLHKENQCTTSTKKQIETNLQQSHIISAINNSFCHSLIQKVYSNPNTIH